jgi:hypothetical protein
MSSKKQQRAGQSQPFHHTTQETETCSCPIHRDRTRPPFTAPLGLPFGNHVDVREIPRREAVRIYNEHHSYLNGDSLHPATLAHHGIHYQGNILGAVTYGYPLLSRKNLYFDEAGELVPEPLTKDDIVRDLPPALHNRATELIEFVDEDEIAECRTVQGDKIAAAERICLGERMANLASAGMARSQARFFNSSNCPSEVEFLVTYIRADFRGSMLRALRGRGWQCIGYTEPSSPGNREHKDIHSEYKWVFACPIESIFEQCQLDEFGM